jgi:uncharacterized protein
MATMNAVKPIVETRPRHPDKEATMAITEQVVWIDDLDESVCWHLLARTAVGRVGFVVDGEPNVLPVNYAVAGNAIVFRTAANTTLHSIADNAAVAFEIDAVDTMAETGWSVVVRGHLSEITDAAARGRLSASMLHPWAPGRRDQWMQITASKVTGRAISRRRSNTDGTLLPYMPPD